MLPRWRVSLYLEKLLGRFKEAAVSPIFTILFDPFLPYRVIYIFCFSCRYIGFSLDHVFGLIRLKSKRLSRQRVSIYNAVYLMTPTRTYIPHGGKEFQCQTREK